MLIPACSHISDNSPHFPANPAIAHTANAHADAAHLRHPADVTSLPAELMQLIAGKLGPTDYVNFRHATPRLYQVLGDPVTRKAMVDATVLKAGAHRRAVGSSNRHQAADASLQAMDFLADAWILLSQQQAQPDAGIRLWEKTREMIESLAHEQGDFRPNLVEDNQLLIASLQRLAAALPARLDTMRVLAMQQLSLELARQAMRRVGESFRAPLLDLLMDLLPLVPENRHTANNVHGLKMMAALLDPQDHEKALARLAILAPREPSIEAALLDLTGPLERCQAPRTSST